MKFKALEDIYVNINGTKKPLGVKQMIKRFVILISIITLFSLPLFGDEKLYEQSKLKKVKINYGKITRLSIISPKGSIQLIKSKDAVIVNAVFTTTSSSKDSLKNSLDLSSIEIRKEKDKIIIEYKVKSRKHPEIVIGAEFPAF